MHLQSPIWNSINETSSQMIVGTLYRHMKMWRHLWTILRHHLHPIMPPSHLRRKRR